MQHILQNYVVYDSMYQYVRIRSLYNLNLAWNSMFYIIKHAISNIVYWTLFWSFWADKTSTTRSQVGQAAELGGSKFEPLQTSACHKEITPEGYSRRQSKDLTVKSMAKLWAQFGAAIQHSLGR